MRHHDGWEIGAQLFEDVELAAEFFLVRFENGELFVGVGRHRTETREMLAAARYSPFPEALVENSCEDDDPVGITAETPALAAQTATRAVEIDHRCEIELNSEAAAGGTGSLPKDSHRATSGGGCFGGLRQITPQGRQPVDHATLEVGGDKWPGVQVFETRNQLPGLFRCFDIA